MEMSTSSSGTTKTSSYSGSSSYTSESSASGGEVSSGAHEPVCPSSEHYDHMKVDFSSYFTTNEEFSTKEELRDWVQKIGLGLNMKITTRSSKGHKMILNCTRSGSYRSGRKKVPEKSDKESGEKFVEENGERSIEKKDKSKRITQRIDCPFRLEGSLRKGNSYTPSCWSLSVIRGYHNHELLPSLRGVRGAHRLTQEEREIILLDSASGQKPKAIFSKLIERNPESLISRTQVYNYKAAQRRKSMGRLNVTQYSLTWLKDKEYFTDTKSEKGKDGGLEMTALFISHKDSRHLLRMFPNVIIMDSTYKTNRYGWPLLEFVGLTSTNLTYCIALVFMKDERTKYFTWALERLKWLLGDQTPRCIMSDRELGALKARKEVFPGVRHLLCQVHVDRNVRAYAKKQGIDPDRFSSSVRRVMRAHTEEEYESRLAHFRETWNAGDGGGLVSYVEKTWFDKHKEKLVSAWSDHILHFATRTTNRVEAQHSMLKNMLQSSVGGFDTIIQHLDNMFKDQVIRIQEEMGRSTSGAPVEIVDGPEWLKVFFQRILERCSRQCIQLLLKQAKLAKDGKISDEESHRDRWWSTAMGLPTPQRIKIYIEEGLPLVPDEINVYWRQTRWGGLEPNDCLPDDGILLSSEHKILAQFVSHWQKGDIDKDTIFKVAQKVLECEEPRLARLQEPPPGETEKGRPSEKKKKTSTKREKTWEEHVDDELRKDNEKMMKKRKRDEEKKKTNEEKKKEREEEKKRKEEERKKRNEEKKKEREDEKKKKDEDKKKKEEEEKKKKEEKLVRPRKPRSGAKGRTIYLGFDWGVDRIDEFMLAYISRVEDVTGDGHCGYRSLAVLLGLDECEYKKVRWDLVRFLRQKRDDWNVVYEGEEGQAIEKLIREVNTVISPCPRDAWMVAPMMGLVFATYHQVAVVVLSKYGPHTCLPLWAPEGAEPPVTVYAIALLGTPKNGHWVPIWLTDDQCPIPPPPRLWTIYKQQMVDGWETHPRFKSRMENYVIERERNGGERIQT